MFRRNKASVKERIEIMKMAVRYIEVRAVSRSYIDGLSTVYRVMLSEIERQPKIERQSE